MQPNTPPFARWTILCQVVDNFGDAGVLWRLARRLAAGDRRTVALRIDAIEASAIVQISAVAGAGAGPGETRPARQARGVSERRASEATVSVTVVSTTGSATGATGITRNAGAPLGPGPSM